jgi:hypothetical protein
VVEVAYDGRWAYWIKGEGRMRREVRRKGGGEYHPCHVRRRPLPREGRYGGGGERRGGEWRYDSEVVKNNEVTKMMRR